MSWIKLTKEHREKIRQGALRSWRSGKRRRRRTKAKMRADRFSDPWEQIRRREEYRENEARRARIEETQREHRESGLPRGVRLLGHGPVVRLGNDAWNRDSQGRRVQFL